MRAPIIMFRAALPREEQVRIILPDDNQLPCAFLTQGTPCRYRLGRVKSALAPATCSYLGSAISIAICLADIKKHFPPPIWLHKNINQSLPECSTPELGTLAADAAGYLHIPAHPLPPNATVIAKIKAIPLIFFYSLQGWKRAFRFSK